MDLHHLRQPTPTCAICAYAPPARAGAHAARLRFRPQSVSAPLKRSPTPPLSITGCVLACVDGSSFVVHSVPFQIANPPRENKSVPRVRVDPQVYARCGVSKRPSPQSLNDVIIVHFVGYDVL